MDLAWERIRFFYLIQRVCRRAFFYIGGDHIVGDSYENFADELLAAKDVS